MINLPSGCGENNLPQLVASLSADHENPEISINFAEVRFYSQGPLVALIAQINKWRAKGKHVTFVDPWKAPAFRYLQRMDFFEACGVKLEEDFDRHDSANRFVTIKHLPDSESAIEKVAGQIADCISPWEDVETPECKAWDIIVYCFTEMANNAIQHSGGNAYAAAQFIGKRNLVRAAIGDNGMGIRESFIRAGLGRSWSDLDAIQHAFRFRVSSKGSAVQGLIGEPRNAGVGLTILRGLIQLSGGTLTLLSGNGYYRLFSDRSEKYQLLPGNFAGTVCCVEFKKGQTVTIDQVLTSLEAGGL